MVEKQRSEFLQILVFLTIFLGNTFLLTRYYSRGDTIGSVFFATVILASGVAVVGHSIEWKRARNNSMAGDSQ